MMRGLDLIGADRAKEADVMKTLNTAVTIGGVVGAVALACLWRSHRVVGGLLGLFVVGPVVGFGAGYVIVRDDLKDITSAQRAQYDTATQT